MPIMAVPQRLIPNVDDLRKFYVGRDITEVPKPALILDRAKMRRHCQSLLNAVDSLGVDFRAHVKTHKVRQKKRPPLASARERRINAHAPTRPARASVSRSVKRARTSNW